MEETQIDLLAKSLSNLTADIKKQEQELEEKISYYDKMLSEFYHLFEFAKLPAHIRAKLDKKFDICLRERRIVKENHSKIMCIKDKLKNSGLNFNTINLNKNKSFSVEILKDEYNECNQYFKGVWKTKE